MRESDGSRQECPCGDTFVTQEVPQVGRPGLMPDYALIETVDRNSIRLPVGRPEFIRAAVGARSSVISTGDPDRPYVLLSQARSAAMTLPIGAGRALPSLILVIVAGLSAPWKVYVVPPEKLPYH